MVEAIDHGSESFARTFRPRRFDNVSVLVLPEDFNPDDSEAFELLDGGVELLLRAGIGGFVFDLTEFARRSDVEEGLGHLVRCTVTVLRSGAALNWLHGSCFVREWKRLNLLGVPPHNFETEQEAVEDIHTALRAARIRTDLAQRVLNSGVSIRDIANLAGVFEDDIRKIAEGREQPSDRVALLISSTLDSLRTKTGSRRGPEGAA